ncbi:MAG: phosphoglucosamine mutase, partial [Thermoleophilia bacterium]|nr:phosphoglucosamine mutase [Thermoleophilia bacterium]
MARLFGTDGIRGVANQPPMTVETAVALGRALARYCRELDKRDIGNRPCVVVGRDTRLSGPMLESAVAAGLCSAGADVLRVGVVPTPAIAFLARQSGAAAGVVISASHNPYYDNGIKVFSGQGFKLSDEEEERLEDLMTELGAGVGEVRESAAGGADAGSKTKGAGAAVGTVSDLADAADRYMAFCLGTFPGSDLAGKRLVLDCAHGATYKVAPAVFRALGAEVEVLNDQPDGVNINADCGSEHPDELQCRVRELGADAGLAFDGDGDRLIAVDELGRLVTGDQLLAVCARFYKEQGWLTNDLVVSTVMSNLGLCRALVQMGLQHATSQVGDRYVLQVMQEKGAVLGGEDSGH